jgi:beta-glucosidase
VPPVPPFRDPSLSFAERAADLLARLTDGEKIAMLHQRSPAVERLGLAEWHTGQEALHGAAWRGPATVFPQAIGLGATFDPELVQAVGEATAREVRAKHDEDPLVSFNVWSPVVNLLRDPRWGRNEEGYSEDPLLTARMAIAYCRGLVGEDPAGYLRTAPTLKHFLAHNNETNRDTSSSSVRPRVLHEYDLRPFKDPVEAGVATGIMPAYNLVNGRPNHVSPLLNHARSWTTPFSWTTGELLICSDAWAPSNLVDTEHYFADHATSHAAAIKAGLDSFTDKDGDGSFTSGHVTEALKRGLITMADVDRAVRRKLLTRLRLGEFDPDGGPFAADGKDALHHPRHRRLAREAATRSIVLLRDDAGLLPLAPAALAGLDHPATIAVIGPLSRALYEDWYSGTLPYKVTVADGLREAANSPKGSEGLDRVSVAMPGGTSLGIFDVADWGNDVITLRDAETGLYLTADPQAGDLTVTSPGPNGWVVHETFIRTRTGDGVLLRSTATGTETPVTWTPVTDGVTAAAEAAAKADTAVVVVGNHPLINGRETQDRTTLHLPPRQQELVRAVTEANPRTVLVIMSSYPFIVPPEARTVLWTSHGGQETGHAVADVITGAASPTARLPQTWYASDDDLPDIGEYDIIKARRTYQYFGGIPQFPFGHGLTYTTFRYSNLRVSRAASAAGAEAPTITALIDVTAQSDTTGGSRGGTEVVQLYADLPAGARRLIGFARVTLAPGETGTAAITFPLAELAIWDVDAHEMVVPAGDYELLAGASSADIRLTATLAVDGVSPGPRRIRGREVRAADFDDQDGIVLVDETRASGDAVTAAGRTARVVFQDADLGAVGSSTATFRINGLRGTIEVRHGDDKVAEVTTLESGGTANGEKYSWMEVSVPATMADDKPRDLTLTLTGDVRLAWFRIS